MNLDIISWKDFVVNDLFEIINGKGITSEEIENNPGDLEAVQSGEGNNGVIGLIDRSYCRDMDYSWCEKPCLTVARSGTSGFVSFHKNGCVVGDSAKILLLKDQNARSSYVYLFIQTLLKANRFKYTYGRKVTEALYGKTIIKLPSTAEGTPDWQWMESYIASLHSKPLTTRNFPHPRPFNTNEWKWFKLQNLFSRFEVGKGHDTILDDGDECFYLGAKKSDNGIMRTCAMNEDLIQKGNCIVFICNGAGSVGYANYMDKPFIGTTDLVMGYADWLNPRTGLFVSTVLCKERFKYSFGRKWKTHLRETQIKLPSTPDGDPDWQWMEDYIKSLPYGDRL